MSDLAKRFLDKYSQQKDTINPEPIGGGGGGVGSPLAQKFLEKYSAPLPVAPAEAPVEKGNALTRGLAGGETMLQSGFGSAIEGFGGAIGLEGVEEFGRGRRVDAEQEAREQAPNRTRLGAVDSVGSALTYFGETLGEQLPMMGQTIAGSIAGGMAGAPLGPAGVLGGAILGGAASNLPLFYGFNREAQREAAQEKGIEVEIDERAAALTAIPQAALDSIADRFIVFGFAPKVGQAILTRIVKGGTRGVATEVPTEIGQEVLQRAQAGQDLTSDAAIQQYIEVGVAAGIIGGTVGGVVGGVAPEKDISTAEEAIATVESGEFTDADLGTQEIADAEIVKSVQEDAAIGDAGGADVVTPSGIVDNTPLTTDPLGDIPATETPATKNKPLTQSELAEAEIEYVDAELLTDLEFEPEPEPTPPPLPVASPLQTEETSDLPGFTKVGPKPGGSSPGGIYKQIDTGKQYIAKKYAEPLMSQNENVAMKLARAAGLVAPRSSVVLDGGNNSVFVSEYLPNLMPFDPNNKEQVAKVQKDFVVQAWLANWDVVGLDYDNIKFDPAGNPVYFDMGGSLLFRAKGGKKGLQFGPTVGEIVSLQNAAINPQAAKVFKGISQEEIKNQVQLLVNNITPSVLDAYIPTGTDATWGKVKDTLWKRLKSLENTYLKMQPLSLQEKKATNTIGKVESVPKGVAGSVLNAAVANGNITWDQMNTLASGHNAAKSKGKATAILKKWISQLENLKLSNPAAFEDEVQKVTAQMSAAVPNEAQAVKDFQSIIDGGQTNKNLNKGILWSYKGNNSMVETILNSPHLLGLMENSAYWAWAKDNKLWWNVETHQLVVGESWKEGYLPGLLFYGAANAKETENPLDMPFYFYNKQRSGKGTGGGDTHLGMFLQEDPKKAFSWANNYSMKDKIDHANLEHFHQANIIPLVANFKKPFLVDHKGGHWHSKYTVKYTNQAKAVGADAVVIVNMKDKGGLGTQIIVFDPNNGALKSPFAEFKEIGGAKAWIASTGEIRQGVRKPITQEDYEKLKTVLVKAGLKDLVALRIFEPGMFQNKLSGAELEGFFGRNSRGLLIGLQNTLDNSWGNVHHEVIHALKHLGFFDTREGRKMWQALTSEVRRRGISDHVKQNYAKKDWVEEEVARLMQKWADNTGPFAQERPLLHKAFGKIVDLFQALVNWGRGYGFRTADEIFEYLVGGSLADQMWLAGTSDYQTDNGAATIYAAATAAKKLGAKLPTDLDYYNRVVKWGWNIIQLAKKNAHIGWLQTYKQLADKWYNEKTRWLARANETIEMWGKLAPKQQDALAKAIFEIEEMAYRTPAEVAKGVARRPTKAELIAIMQKHKVNKSGLATYVKMRKDFDAILDKLQAIANADVARIFGPKGLPIVLLEQAKINKEFQELRKRPYFPHARFGNYTIVVKDGQGKTLYMEAFEDVKSRDAAVASVQKMFPNEKVGRGFLTEEVQPFKGLPPNILASIKNMLEEQAASLPAGKQKTVVEKQMLGIEEMMVKLSPTQSFKNHFVRKENTPGYSKNAIRAYADYFWHAANHIARLEYGPQMQDAVGAGQKENSDLIAQGMDATARGKMVDFVQHHLNEILNPSPDWAALKSIGFTWWLAFNVKSAVLNFTQVPLVTLPYLSAHFGDGKSWTQLARTMAQVQKVFRSPNKVKHTPADMKLLQMGLEQGFLDESFAMELAATAQGGSFLNQLASGTKAQRTFLKFQQAGGYMFQAAEKINRRVTFLAAVELARKNPNVAYLDQVQKEHALEFQEMIANGMAREEARAFLAGKDAVRSSQFEYSAWARPRIMEGRRSAFLTFFMFTQNMLWFIQNSPGSSRYLLTLLVFAGLMGMPGAEDLEALAKYVGRTMFGEEWNAEKELREFLVQYTDDPDLFLRGASRYGFGLGALGDMTGLPLPQVDMSGSVGMGSPLPVISPMIQALGSQNDFQESLANVTQEGVGPTFGIGLGILQALADTQLPLDDPKRWEKAMPAFLGNAVKAVRQGVEGKERFRNSAGPGGPAVVDFDPNDPEQMAELIAQGLGFRPTRTAETWDKVLLQREVEAFWMAQRARHMTEYDRAVANGEPVDEALQAIRRFNLQTPYPSFRIGRDNLQRSLASRRRSRERAEAGLPNSRMGESVYQDVERLFPERSE